MGSGRLYSASDVLMSFLGQLCQSSHNIMPDRLRQIYQQSNSGLPKLEELLEALKQVSQNIDQPITFVMDGLDKANIHDENDFTKVFNSLKDISGKWLITSRIDQNMLPDACHGCSQYVIREDNAAEDIRNFVKSTIQENEATDKLLSSAPEFRSKVIDTLTSQARGM